MKKIFAFLIFLVFIGILSSCDDNPQEMGRRLDETLSTLKGEDSVILNFEVKYEEEFEYDIYINHKKDYQGLHIKLPGESIDYRYVIKDVEEGNYYYYEYNIYNTDSHRFSKSIASGKDDYVYDKLSFDDYDIPNLTFSIEEIINMINNNKVIYKIITSDDERLQDLQLYEITFDLDYFVEHNPDVLKALYGRKINNMDILKDKKQTIVLGHHNETDRLRYFAYSQNAILEAVHANYKNLDIKIFIEAYGQEAETLMEPLESSDVFPNENNTIDN